MRLASETPQTDLEQFIEDVLVGNEYDRLGAKVLLQLGEVIVAEEDIYDDDCGWLFYYRVKKS